MARNCRPTREQSGRRRWSREARGASSAKWEDPMKFVDQWNDLLCLPPWTPLDQLGFEATQIEGVLYRLTDEAYISALPRDKDLRPVEVPRITAVLWAANLGVARRVLLHDRQADKRETPQVPQTALLSTARSFDEVLRHCEANVGHQIRIGVTADAEGRHLITSISQRAILLSRRVAR
jgi:hypothetical protein